MSMTKIEFPNPLEFQDHEEKWAFSAKEAVPFRPPMAPFRPQNAPFLSPKRTSCARIEQEKRVGWVKWSASGMEPTALECGMGWTAELPLP